MGILNGLAYCVTGAASGIGLATAQRMAEEGAGVLLCDLQEAALAEAARSIEAAGGRCATLAGDVSAPDHPQRMVDKVLDAFGRVDGFVPCAGRILIRSIQEVTRAEWDSIFAVNLTAVFFGSRAIAEAMKNREIRGSIVTVSSTSAHGARPNNADYGASKLSVDHITRTLALEYAPANIRVNAVSPGIIDTPMWRAVEIQRGAHLGIKPEELSEKMRLAVPMRRFADPREMADVILFLLSDAASYLTGQIIEMDGGFKLCNP